MELQAKIMKGIAVVGFFVAICIAVFFNDAVIYKTIGIISVGYVIAAYMVIGFFFAALFRDYNWTCIVTEFLFFVGWFAAAIIFHLLERKAPFLSSLTKTVIFGIVTSFLYFLHILFRDVTGKSKEELMSLNSLSVQQKAVLKYTAVVGFSVSVAMALFVNNELVLAAIVIVVGCTVCALFLVSCTLEAVSKKFRDITVDYLKIISPVLVGICGYTMFFEVFFPYDEAIAVCVIGKYMLFGVTLSVLLAEWIYYNRGNNRKPNG